MNRIKQAAEAGLRLVERERQQRAEREADQARREAEQQANLARRRRERHQQKIEAIATRLMAEHGRMPFRAAIRRCGVWKGDHDLIGYLRGLWVTETARKLAGVKPCSVA